MSYDDKVYKLTGYIHYINIKKKNKVIIKRYLMGHEKNVTCRWQNWEKHFSSLKINSEFERENLVSAGLWGFISQLCSDLLRVYFL